jgi:hypothetical protein
MALNPSPKRAARAIVYGIIPGMGCPSAMANFWARKSTAELLDEAAQSEATNGEVRTLKRTLSALNLASVASLAPESSC